MSQAPQHVRVARCDARALARALTEADERPTLVYLDPPFAAERDFYTSAGDGGAKRLAYSDRWGSLETYLAFMNEVLERVHGMLAQDGSLLLHCDHRAAPYLAIACDRIFGLGDRGPTRQAPGFRNELIWSYGLGGSSPRCYPKKHDTILWYSRGPRWIFDAPRVPATSHRMAGQTKKAPDVLSNPTINNMARERTGYPTQKPLALLELLVLAHSRPGDLVVDLFSGSGTTAIAATSQGRRVLVGDESAVAIETTIARLEAAGFGVELIRPDARATSSDAVGSAEGPG